MNGGAPCLDFLEMPEKGRRNDWKDKGQGREEVRAKL